MNDDIPDWQVDEEFQLMMENVDLSDQKPIKRKHRFSMRPRADEITRTQVEQQITVLLVVFIVAQLLLNMVFPITLTFPLAYLMIGPLFWWRIGKRLSKENVIHGYFWGPYFTLAFLLFVIPS